MLAARAICIPGLDVLVTLTVINCHDAVAYGCGGLQLKEGETFLNKL